ncbi:hypothetical protein VYU27_006026 [Nannochloropsis oceanica]
MVARADGSISSTTTATPFPETQKSLVQGQQKQQEGRNYDSLGDIDRQGQHERPRKSEAFHAEEEALNTQRAGATLQQPQHPVPSFDKAMDDSDDNLLSNFDALLAEVMLGAEEVGLMQVASSLSGEGGEALYQTSIAPASGLGDKKAQEMDKNADSVTLGTGQPSLHNEHHGDLAEAHHRALSHKKKTGSAVYYPDGNFLPATAVGGAGGLGGRPGIGLAPSVRPGITLGVTRFRDSIDARNRKVKRGGHALCTNFRFIPPLSFPAEGVGPSNVEIGDLNGDCIKDLVVSASGSDVIVIFLGCGDGTFFPGVRYPVGPPGSFPYRVRLADVNHDGRLDIITANLGGAALSILLGRGDGTFTNGFVFPTGGGGPVDLALGDFNGDGILDVALALAQCESLTILFGDGRGSFVRPLEIALGSGFPLSILAVDLNLDGFADLVVGMSALGRNLAVLTSLGDGTFRRPVLHELGKHNRPVSLAVGYFNCDLFPDIVLVNGGSDNSLSVLLGRGDGSFRTPRSFSVSPGLAPMALAVGDFNGDLIPDIVTANALSNDVTILRGHGDGTFSRVRTFPVDGVGIPGPAALAVGLLNKDIKHDIVVVHFSGNLVSILLNTCTKELFKHI